MEASGVYPNVHLTEQGRGGRWPVTASHRSQSQYLPPKQPEAISLEMLKQLRSRDPWLPGKSQSVPTQGVDQMSARRRPAPEAAGAPPGGPNTILPSLQGHPEITGFQAQNPLLCSSSCLGPYRGRVTSRETAARSRLPFRTHGAGHNGQRDKRLPASPSPHAVRSNLGLRGSLSFWTLGRGE